jgi:hypothetical protein
MPSRVFLESKSPSDFAEQRVRFGRTVKSLSHSDQQPSEPLEDLVKGLVHDRLREHSHGFRCLGIEVEDRDGMSWSARLAESVIAEEAPRARCLRLIGEPGVKSYPDITQIIRMRQIARLAKKRGLVTSVRLIGIPLYTVIVVGAIAAGAAGAVLTSFLKDGRFTAASLPLPFLGITVLIAALGFAANYLTNALNLTDAPPLFKVASDIAAHAIAAQPISAYDQFINDLAAKLGQFADLRCLIVDNVTGLDPITRSVLEAYLKSYASELRSEVWILFYSADDKSFEFLINRPKRANRGPIGYRYTRLYRLERLSSAQTTALAELNGTPERAHFRRVGDIVREDSSVKSMMELFQRQYQARRNPSMGTRQADDLDLFYVFAMNTAGVNRWLPMTRIKSDFAAERRYRSQVLRLLLPGFRLSKALMDAQLRGMSDIYSPLALELSEFRPREFRATPDSGRVLEQSWRKYDLASPAIVHLFWTLYWSDTGLHGSPDVALLRKISAHILKSVTPAQIGYQLGDQKYIRALTDELFNTVLEVVRACLKNCWLVDVPGLLDYALRLISDDNGRVEQRRRVRLRPLAWQSYGLLGDERLLSVIAELDTEGSVRSRTVSVKRDRLIYLFLQSIPHTSDQARELMRRELGRGGTVSHAAGYARIRAAWLAASFAPFLAPGSVTLTAALNDAKDRLPEIVAESIAELESMVEEEWRTTDVMNVVVGLWSLTLVSFDRRTHPALSWEPSEALDAALVMALVRACRSGTVLADQRRAADPSPVTLDLVLDCVAEELLVVVLAAGVLLLTQWPDSVWTESVERLKVVDAVRESALALGIAGSHLPDMYEPVSADLIGETRRRMALLTVLWRRLGFTQQASFMAIREAQFTAQADVLDADAAQKAMELLAGELDQPDHVGLLAHIAAAECASVSSRLTAELLTRTSSQSMRDGCGDRMSADLWVGALDAGHNYDIDFSECLDFFLDRWNGSNKRRFNRILYDIPVENLPQTVLWFLNALHGSAYHRVDEVHAAFDLRMPNIADPVIKYNISLNFRISALERHINARLPVDTDLELNAWREARDFGNYAYVLGLLLPFDKRGTRHRMTAEALRVLKAPDRYLGSIGYIYLALQLWAQLRFGRDAASPQDREAVLGALRTGFEEWENKLSPNNNLTILGYLIESDIENAEYYNSKHLEWMKVALELHEAQRLPQLIKEGRYFLLILNYYNLLAWYGLQTVPPIPADDLDYDKIEWILQEWRADGYKIPDPTTGNIGDEQLSGDFLRRGYAVFAVADEKLTKDPVLRSKVEVARSQFDWESRDAVETMFQMLRRLQRIPEPIQQILQRHEDLVLTRMYNVELEPVLEP